MTPGRPPHRAYPKRPKAPPRKPPTEQAPRLVLGLQPVREAIRAHQGRVGEVLLEDTRGESRPRLDALARMAASQGVLAVRWVSRRELDVLAGATLHQGAAAWAPELGLVPPETLLATPGLLAVALDGIKDPQNFGAVVRSAVGLGASAVVWPENASAPLTPATFRASAGAVEHAVLCRVPSLVRFLDEAHSAGAEVVGLAPDADTMIHHMDLGGPTVLVLGSEHEGLGRAVRRRCGKLARLSLAGPIDSLNASVACAVALYVARIQREKISG